MSDSVGMNGAPDANEANRLAFSTPETVSDYVAMTDLTPTEAQLFDRFVPVGARVLDLGIGTGRTTQRLSAGATRYVGLDYSEAMVEQARARHPDADLVVADASDLSDFADGSFDVVVFSYNGLDYLHPDAKRLACLVEVRRVLAPGGHFVFSVHNPRCLVRPAQRPLTARRIGIAIYQTMRRIAERMTSPTFRAGKGYDLDRVRGGLVTHSAVPASVVAETEAVGFDHLATIGGDEPRIRGTLRTRWWYYAFERADRS